MPTARSAREDAFKKEIEQLTRLKSAGMLERPDRIASTAWDEAPSETADASDPNEPNDLPDVLTVIARAEEFANSDQKKELLSDTFVEKALQTAVDRSVLLEAQGKWLDAYTSYFYWLQAIDPNNKGYSEHAEELLDRASIAVSFQDSPCESRKERYEGVEKRMLTQVDRGPRSALRQQHRLCPDGAQRRSSGAIFWPRCLRSCSPTGATRIPGTA